jgi:hypothetical protein
MANTDEILREINGEFRFGDEGFIYLGKTFKYECLDLFVQFLSMNYDLPLELGLYLAKDGKIGEFVETPETIENSMKKIVESYYRECHICPKCKIAFTRSDNLLRHSRNCHFCVTCKKRFSNSSKLRRHSRKCNLLHGLDKC